MRHIDDRERRARLAVRHGLHPLHRLPDPVAVTGAMTVLHATEAATVYLAINARADRVGVADIDRALYQDRTLVKQLAMRSTLFVLPRDLLPAALGSASVRVAAEQHRRLARDVQAHGIAADGPAWLQAATTAVLARLEEAGPLAARQLREDLPQLAGAFTVNADKTYGGTFQISPRVLSMLGAQGRITRGPNAGHWRTSRPTWTLMTDWLGGEVVPLTLEQGYAELVRRWLRTFGPGTLDDVQWWLGSTRTAARAAMAAVGAVEVTLEGAASGWVLPDDLERTSEVEPWAALLPTLDPTTMGWRVREFYLDPAHVPHLFDTNGNAGNTAWWDGRVVGAWVQDPDAVVQVVLCQGMEGVIGREGMAALDTEAARLTTWLDGVQITNVYSSRLMKGAPLP